MKFNGCKSIVSVCLLGLSGMASAGIDMEFYLPNGMVNTYPGSAKTFVVSYDGKTCKIGNGQSACTISSALDYRVARVDWYNATTLPKDHIASTAFVVRRDYQNNPLFTQIPLPVGMVHVTELTGTNPGGNIGLYLVPSNDLVNSPADTSRAVNLPRNYNYGLKHYEITPRAVSWSSVVRNENAGEQFPVLAGTYTPITYRPNGPDGRPAYLTATQTVNVGMGTLTTIKVDSTQPLFPMEIDAE